MLYTFNDFKFDSKNLLLTKNGEPIDLRHNEIKLLALLLENQTNVLSKEAILAYIWQDKVVSEQAVFQNISHLRNLFGNEAIKTFPKRGYQWQLTTETTPPLKPAHPAKRPIGLYAILASFVFVLMTFIYWQAETNQEGTDSVIKLAYIPFSNSPDSSDPQNSSDQQNINLQNFMALTLEDNVHFNFTAITHLNTEQFQTSAELEYPLVSAIHPFVLTGEVREFKQQFYLDFLLKGPFADLQGQLSGLSQDEVAKKLLEHLEQTFIYDLLSKQQSPQLKQAKLTIAHQQAPEDLIILGSLINVYIEIGELEKAMVMADKLANIALSQNNSLQTGNALLYQSKILTRKKLFDLSLEKLDLAIKQFEEIDDLKRQSDAWFAQSWLDHQNNDYPAIKTSLLKASKLAYQAKDKAREIESLTYLSILAHKHRQQADKYSYLQQAESKMKAYQLPIYHFGKVPFHYAIFAKNPHDKEPHLKQVLEFTALTPDVWFAQGSRLQLLQHYLKQDRLIEAQALVDNVTTDNANNSFLKTLLAQAQQQSELMISYAKQTFEQAQLAGYRSLSLDVALLLCNTPENQSNADFYSQYILENATEYWRRDNETQLMALNL